MKSSVAAPMRRENVARLLKFIELRTASLCRVLISVKKHQGDVQAQGRNLSPGIIEFEGPMDISNVMLVCPSCDEATRIGIRRNEDGAAHRVCKRCEAEID